MQLSSHVYVLTKCIIAVWIYRLCPVSSRLHWQKLFKVTQHTDVLWSDLYEQYAWGPVSASDGF